MVSTGDLEGCAAAEISSARSGTVDFFIVSWQLKGTQFSPFRWLRSEICIRELRPASAIVKVALQHKSSRDLPWSGGGPEACVSIAACCVILLRY
jgi:hypothetical protein